MMLGTCVFFFVFFSILHSRGLLVQLRYSMTPLGGSHWRHICCKSISLLLIHVPFTCMLSSPSIYLRALQHAVIGCGSNFEPFITTDLLQLIFTSLGHANRFVRETGFKVISSIVQCPGLSKVTTDTHWPVVAENLARGLADNWSQVL